jgi:hypothetical protein
VYHTNSTYLVPITLRNFVFPVETHIPLLVTKNILPLHDLSDGVRLLFLFVATQHHWHVFCESIDANGSASEIFLAIVV